MAVRPAKTQISLGIRPVWSESLLCAQWVAKDQSFLHADSEDSDQTGRIPRLIWVLAGRTAILLVLSCRGCEDQLTLKCTTQQWLFSLFQNVELGIASIDDECHSAISWARSCQYQCVCKRLSKYSKWSWAFFANCPRIHNFTNWLGTNYFTHCPKAIIGHTLKVNLQLRLTFLRSCINVPRFVFSVCHNMSTTLSCHS